MKIFKRCILISVLLLFAVTVVITAMMFRTDNKAIATSISHNAEKTLEEVKTLSIVRNNTFYEDGSIARGVRETIWIEIPNKFYSTSDYTLPDNNVLRDVLIKNEEGTVLLSCGPDGSYTYAQLFVNTSPFPGDERSYNPIYEGYITQLNVLVTEDNFQVLSNEKVNGREAKKIEMHIQSEHSGGACEYWYVDNDTSLCLREEVFQDGELIYRSDVESLDINCAFPVDSFKFSIPEYLNSQSGNLEIIDQYYRESSEESIPTDLDYKPLFPEYIPDGFELVKVGYVIDEPAVWQNPFYLTYSNENKYIYICEDAVRSSGQGDAFYALGLDYYNATKIEIMNGIAYLYPKGDYSGTLYFNVGNMKVKITGNVELEEIKKIADSMISASR